MSLGGDLPEILFENKQVLIVDKPSGYLSVPSRFGRGDARPVVGLLLKEYVGQNIFPVHRLDEETSGLLVFAKTTQAQVALNRAFEQHVVKKSYQAITETKIGSEALLGSTLKNKLFRGKKRSFEAPHGQQAETLVTHIQPYDSKYLLWNLQPITGRSHQLRVQLALRGFPILGDVLYGSSLNIPKDLFLPHLSQPEKAIALRSVSLDFSEAKDINTLEMPFRFQTKGWLKALGDLFV